MEPKGSFTGFKREESLTGPVPGTNGQNPATLHPVKTPAYQYRLHKYMLSRESNRLRNEVYLLQRQINELNGTLQVILYLRSEARKYYKQIASTMLTLIFMF